MRVGSQLFQRIKEKSADLLSVGLSRAVSPRSWAAMVHGGELRRDVGGSVRQREPHRASKILRTRGRSYFSSSSGSEKGKNRLCREKERERHSLISSNVQASRCRRRMRE